MSRYNLYNVGDLSSYLGNRRKRYVGTTGIPTDEDKGSTANVMTGNHYFKSEYYPTVNPLLYTVDISDEEKQRMQQDFERSIQDYENSIVNKQLEEERKQQEENRKNNEVKEGISLDYRHFVDNYVQDNNTIGLVVPNSRIQYYSINPFQKVPKVDTRLGTFPNDFKSPSDSVSLPRSNYANIAYYGSNNYGSFEDVYKMGSGNWSRYNNYYLTEQTIKEDEEKISKQFKEGKISESEYDIKINNYKHKLDIAKKRDTIEQIRDSIAATMQGIPFDALYGNQEMISSTYTTPTEKYNFAKGAGNNFSDVMDILLKLNLGKGIIGGGKHAFRYVPKIFGNKRLYNILEYATDILKELGIEGIAHEIVHRFTGDYKPEKLSPQEIDRLERMSNLQYDENGLIVRDKNYMPIYKNTGSYIDYSKEGKDRIHKGSRIHLPRRIFKSVMNSNFGYGIIPDNTWTKDPVEWIKHIYMKHYMNDYTNIINSNNSHN
jgi:hypothetical protein